MRSLTGTVRGMYVSGTQRKECSEASEGLFGSTAPISMCKSKFLGGYPYVFHPCN